MPGTRPADHPQEGLATDISAQPVFVTDVRIPFGSMVVLMIKWVLASMPALFVLILMTSAFWALVSGLFMGFGR